MASITEMLDEARRKARGPRQRKKDISGHGDGIWQTRSALASYRRKRNKKNAAAKAARRANR